MVLYIIGLGLNENSISIEAKEALTKCEKAYLENYTIDFPYELSELEKNLGKNIFLLDREEVESEKFLKEARKKNVALLVYGDPFSATTHSQIILSCIKQKIPYIIFHNSSIINAIGEIGLSLYKFGKTCSLPKWKENFKPTSFINYLKENKKIEAHSLVLVDIGLSLKEALEELEEASKKENFSLPEKIIVVSCLGTKKQKIIYKKIENLKKEKIDKPFCLIIASEKMHFLEEEFINSFN